MNGERHSNKSLTGLRIAVVALAVAIVIFFILALSTGLRLLKARDGGTKATEPSQTEKQTEEELLPDVGLYAGLYEEWVA